MEALLPNNDISCGCAGLWSFEANDGGQIEISDFSLCDYGKLESLIFTVDVLGKDCHFLENILEGAANLSKAVFLLLISNQTASSLQLISKNLDLVVSGEMSTLQYDTIFCSASGSPLESVATAVNPI